MSAAGDQGLLDDVVPPAAGLANAAGHGKLIRHDNNLIVSLER